MPQMAPMWWTTLFLFFIACYMVMMIMMFFYFKLSPKSFSENKNNKQMNWKW